MSTIKKLNKKLSDCCEQLVDCTAIIRDLPFEPVKDSVYKLGKAIAEISELRSEIYKVHPGLKPEMWDKPPSEEDYEEMYQQASLIANEYIQAGKPERAVETYESYIFIGPTEKFVDLAKNEIKKIKSGHHV